MEIAAVFAAIADMADDIVVREMAQRFEHGLQIALIGLVHGFIPVKIRQIEIDAVYEMLRGDDEIERMMG